VEDAQPIFPYRYSICCPPLPSFDRSDTFPSVLLASEAMVDGAVANAARAASAAS
jgi:hypothetical protein